MSALPSTQRDRRMLRFAMNLSLAAGLLMFVIKFGAYLLTGSSAIFADAMETIVHILAVGFASYSLRLSQKPPDESHPYGHAKIGFFSAGAEGTLIVIAALLIIHDAVLKWLAGPVVENIGLGSVLTALTVLINAALGGYLLWVGKREHSVILEANGKHVLTDAWTSIGVIVGLALTALTGWLPWDPIFAILVAINILITGGGLIRGSIRGLMDEADPAVRGQLIRILDEEVSRHRVRYHALRHRNLGDGHWVDFHLLFTDETPIRTAHAIATKIERALVQQLPSGSLVTTHLEPLADHERLHTHTDED